MSAERETVEACCFVCGQPALLDSEFWTGQWIASSPLDEHIVFQFWHEGRATHHYQFTIKRKHGLTSS